MIGGFRIERLLGTGSIGAVYEATQLSLRRTVALRLIDADHFTTVDQLARFDARQRLVAAVHHPNLVACYEVGAWEGGRFIAMRFMHGRTLAELRGDGAPISAAALGPVADALAALHGAGVAHARISERDIFFEADGTPYLTDVGLAESGNPEADSRALAALLSRLPAQAASTRSRSAVRPSRLVAAALVALAVIAVALIAGGRDDQPGAVAAPPSLENTTAFGSALPADGVEPLGCTGDPSPSTPACTLAQSTLEGEPLVVRRRGAIRAWAVRGASGEIALQVIRERDGGAFTAAFSQPQHLDDADPAVFPAEVAVRPGDRIGVRLGPGATIGARTGVSASTVARWDGGLVGEPPRAADTTTPGIELMLRADIEVGARPEGPRLIVGERAASAPAGRTLGDIATELAGGKDARVAIVALSDGIVIDVLRRRRVARLAIPDADPQGDLLELTQNCGPAGARGFCLRWHNPGVERPLTHEYRVRGSGRVVLIG